ncbi:Toprim-like [Catalinimonas alkaloidigena]|uniref:Toprim-like n=1 Tax=Catalinimonas alkaloidigena TaxID=1075417 RepID=A0A1G9U448_9BACT|nr:toprim domain-containing protein [Catalinimonas alkaloidigena]SDM54716.1 Toprim-like [Catalinimonas alkaloidigena]
MAYDFTYFKQRVSIIQAAEALGYRHNPHAGRNPVEYCHPEHANVIIRNPHDPVKQLYFTRHDDTNRGSVIDFVRHRLHLFGVRESSEMAGVNKVLHQLAQVDYQPTALLPEVGAKKTFVRERYHCRPAQLQDLGYLQRKRGLSEETLLAFLPYLQKVVDLESAKKWENIGFPYRVVEESQWRGLELVNYHFKRFAAGSDRQHACWFAGCTMVPEKVMWAESAIDAMSFFQLSQRTSPTRFSLKHTLYVAVGGALARAQAEHVLRLYPYARHYTIFDADLAGRLQTIRLAAYRLGVSLTLRREQHQVHFQLPDRTFAIPIDEISLHRFRTLSHLNVQLVEYRPRGKDFNQMLTE